MKPSIYLTTLETGSGKSLVVLGILDYLIQRKAKVGFFRPVIDQKHDGDLDPDIELMRRYFRLDQSHDESYAWTIAEVNELAAYGQQDEILARIIGRYKALEQRCDFMVIEGTDFNHHFPMFEFDLNGLVARELGAPVLFIAQPLGRTPRELTHQLHQSIALYQERRCQCAGIMINRVPDDVMEPFEDALKQSFPEEGLLIGTIAAAPFLGAPSLNEIRQCLNASVLLGEEHLEAGAIRTVVGGMQLEHLLKGLRAGDLLLLPLDRVDLLVGLLLWDRSAQSVPITGIVLIGQSDWETPLERFAWLAEVCPSFPVLRFCGDFEQAQSQLATLRPGLYPDQTFRIRMAIDHFTRFVDLEILQARLGALPKPGLSTNLFLYQLHQRAKRHIQHIVLPEGEEPRIQAAARLLIERKLVRLTLLGRIEVMAASFKSMGLTLDPEWISLVDPSQSDWLEPFSERYTALRAHKGMTMVAARDRMMDVSYFGTMMVHEGRADGMVSGAIHTTQHTILPAFQFIKTKPGFSIVSSVFFMCLADGVVVYGDCAVNPCPTAEELAQIAVSSADTARAFGLDPNVALLSYSSGQSGVGDEVERVREAVRLARILRPDLSLDGPIQYDAAVDPGVAHLKMPDSSVAGHANVLVFPDLNTGNNTYKAVQRETGAIAIGPILQGLRKPVNDLSRGCTVEDVFHTVIMTAIQAQDTESLA